MISGNCGQITHRLPYATVPVSHEKNFFVPDKIFFFHALVNFPQMW